MKFSVIIPLEFNRGLAVRCIRAWVSDQTYTRNEFEIIVAASKTHPATELEAIRDILLPRDRLLQFPVSHDMALVTAAAKEALGDIFVFTESHCIPCKDFLEKSASVMEERTEWAGFSGMSYPITHNLLSIVESELYERDINTNLNRHEWLKVLDQCFIIRRRAYRASGGIEPAYGHFAEWLLAARLHAKGLKIGHVPEIKVGHYYIGDLNDLEDFTKDFTRGEMKFISGSSGDPCFGFFPTPQPWIHRSLWNESLTKPFFRLLRSNARMGAGLLTLVSRFKALSPRRQLTLTKLRLFFDFCVLRLSLFIRLKPLAKTVFQRWICHVVDLERLNFIDQFYRNSAKAPIPPITKKWTAETAGCWESLGFHEPESFQGVSFRWSQPAACVRLRLAAGTWKITIQFAPFVPANLNSHGDFFANGIPLRKISPAFHGSHAEFHCKHKGGDLDIAWISKRFRACGDTRRLGLPIEEIRWEKMDEKGFQRVDSTV